MDLEFFFFPGSFYSQKVLFVLEEKEIPYKAVFVNLPAGETSSPEYLQNVNEKGQVPAVKHRGLRLSGSNDIVKYLDTNFPGVYPMYPSDDTDEGKKINHFLSELDKIGIEILTFGSMVHIDLTKDCQIPEHMAQAGARKMRNKEASGALREKMEKYPQLKEIYGKKIGMAGKFEEDTTNRDTYIKCVEACKAFFDEIESTLSSNAEAGKADHFLYGNTFSFADSTLAVTMQRLKFVGLFKDAINDGKHPYCLKYYNMLLERPTFRKTCIKGYDKRTVMYYMLMPKVKRVLATVAFLSVAGTAVYFAIKSYKS